jgi:hypothetical protein
MSAEFLSQDRLSRAFRTSSRSSDPLTDAIVGDEGNASPLDQEDYRSFVIERRQSVLEAKNQVLARWLAHRKSADTPVE